MCVKHTQFLFAKVNILCGEGKYLSYIYEQIVKIFIPSGNDKIGCKDFLRLPVWCIHGNGITLPY